MAGIVTTDLQERPLMRPLKSMTHVTIMVAPNDENAYDNNSVLPIDDIGTRTSGSLYLHQHSTMMSEQ